MDGVKVTRSTCEANFVFSGLCLNTHQLCTILSAVVGILSTRCL